MHIPPHIYIYVQPIFLIDIYSLLPYFYVYIHTYIKQKGNISNKNSNDLIYL